MPIIKPKVVEDEAQIRVRLKKSVIKQMDDYISWAKISNQNHFIEEAISYVLSKDKDWNKFKNSEA